MVQTLPASKRLSRNVIANSVDTLVAEISQTEPRALFTSIGGTWIDQAKAKKLTSYGDDMTEHLEVDELRPQVLRDGVIAGLGILRCVESGDDIEAERIYPGDFLIDDRAATSCLPRDCFVRRRIDRRRLMALYPEHADAIETAGEPDYNNWHVDDGARVDRTQDLVEVWEAWHLPSEDDADDGRHVLCIEEVCLVDEPYERMRFPFAFFRPIKPIRGFWGESLVKRAESAQLELNKLLRRIQDSQHMHARPLIFLPRQAGIPKAHLTNDVGTIVEFDGQQPPVTYTPPSMNAEVYAHVDRLEQYVMREFAVNETAAQGQVPTHLKSGKAIRMAADTSSRRFIDIKRASERLHVDFIRELVALERVLSERYPEREVMYERFGARVRIKWSEIDLDDAHMRIKAFPTSALPNEPAGRIESLEEMMQQGVLDQEQFWQLAAGVPDFEQVRDDFVAPTELLKQTFHLILEDGEYIAPEPYMNLELGLNLCSRILQRAELDGAPEERCDMLRQWLVDAQRLIERGQPPAPPMGPPMGGPEMPGPPMPPDGMMMPPDVGMPPMPGGETPMGPPGMPPMPPGMPPMA